MGSASKRGMCQKSLNIGGTSANSTRKLKSKRIKNGQPQGKIKRRGNTERKEPKE